MPSRSFLPWLVNARLLLSQRPPARVDRHCFFRTAGKLSAFGANSLLALAGALYVLVLSGATARAQVSLTSLVTFDGTLYNYNYSVGNLGSLDLAIISLDVLPQPNALLNPAAPTGFLINFDPGVGQVSFFEDTDSVTPQTFGPGSTVSGFIFQSPIAPGPSSFTALDVNGNTFMGTTGVTRPKFASILRSGTNLIITGTGGTSNATYAVLTSTNVALPLSNWTSIATNQFGAGGGFSFTNGIGPGTSRRFYRIRTP